MTDPYNQACESDAPPAHDGDEPEAPLWVVRHGRETDWPFLIASWVRSHADTWLSSALGHTYVQEHSRAVKEWLAHPGTQVRVAVDPSDSDAILGFAVWFGSIVHYVYVRPGMRRMGCAKAMLEDLKADECTYTHRISKGTRYSSALIPETWSYNPYLFLRGPK